MTDSEDFRERLGEPACHIPAAGDCIDAGHLNAILAIANPVNPAYTVNAAIGVVLSSDKGIWARRQAAKEETFREMAEIWAGNLTKTRLGSAYFTDAVIPESECEWIAGYRGVGKRLYEMFCGQLRRNGWEIEEREGVITRNADGSGKVGKLLAAHR